MVSVTWDPLVRLDLGRLQAQLVVWRGAVRPGAAFATVTGAVCREDGGWLLEASGTWQHFQLVAPPAASRAARAAWDTLPARVPEAGARLRVSGEVRASKGDGLMLVVSSVEAPPG
jgi:hypothetical protein